MEGITVLDPAIDDFFAERKEAWLKKNISATMQEWEVPNMLTKYFITTEALEIAKKEDK